TDVLQGHYQQPEEMMTRARLLGYDLTIPQVVVIFELSSHSQDVSSRLLLAQWNKRVRDELLRVWPTCWVLAEARRVIALLPLPALIVDGKIEEEQEHENAIHTRLERLLDRLSPETNKISSVVSPEYSCGSGRIAQDLQGIPSSFREAQQALEI